MIQNNLFCINIGQRNAGVGYQKLNTNFSLQELGSLRQLIGEDREEFSRRQKVQAEKKDQAVVQGQDSSLVESSMYSTPDIVYYNNHWGLSDMRHGVSKCSDMGHCHFLKPTG